VLAGRSDLAYAATAPFRHPRPYEPALDFALRDPDSAPWGITPFLLRRISDPAVAERRRDNYRLLVSRLREHVPEPFGDLTDGASPFAFPIQVEAKGRFLARLRQWGVNALDLWSVPHPALATERFPGAASRRATTVGLPVHQELRRRDLERIVTAVGDALRRL
jgi:dTDP-4-amino-4,6-dideoxygalactose transaminase